MRRFWAVLTVCCSAQALADDLGRLGPTFPVAERDLLEVFRERAQARVDDGSWQQALDQQRDKLKAFVARPQGKRLPRALEYSVRYFDPSIVMDHDISDVNGTILVAQGTRVNPLDYHNYPRTLCFFDGDDAAQVEWAKQYCLDPVTARAILTNGPVLDLGKQLGAMLYFDQYGRLVRHFGIRAVPSVVRQTGKVFAIEEFGVGP